MEEQDGRSKILKNRGIIIETAVLAVCLSLGVNLLASGILAISNASGTASLLGGAVASAAALAFILIRGLAEANRSVTFSAVVATTLQNGVRTLVEIERYDLSEDLGRYFKALAAENKALSKAWTTPTNSEDAPAATITEGSLAATLVREAIEYYVLNSLSVHLSDHFNGSSLSAKNIVTYGRKSIPTVLLDNRFLDLFSRPMEERDSFEEHLKSPPDHGTVVTAYGPGGAFFDNFELVLPKGTRVERTATNTIRIKSWRFDLQFSIGFRPWGATLPRDFAPLYLKKRFIDTHCYQASISFDTRFSILTLLTPLGRQHYQWIESFIDRIEPDLSFNTFATNIGWETALTTMIAQTSPRKGQPSGNGAAQEEVKHLQIVRLNDEPQD